MEATINKESTTTESNAFYWYSILALDSVKLLKHKHYLARMGASYLLQCIVTEKQNNQINTL